MSDLLLLTVQGREREGLVSAADKNGLTDYLGYRPVFCTRIDEESLSETWFRIWAASPLCPEEIIVFSMPEEDCIPMNLIEWSNKCLCREPDSDTIKSVLNDSLPEATDYLVKEIPEDAMRVPVMALYYTTDFYESILRDMYNAPESVVSYAKEAAEIFQQRSHAMLMSGSGVYGKTQVKETIESIYWAVRVSGVIPFLWSVYTGNSMNPGLLAINAADFVGTPSYLRAQELIFEWDNAISEKREFTLEQYRELRDEFIKTLNLFAAKHTELIAKSKGIGRNDACFCGSGKKFKKCHEKTIMDELVKLNS